MVKPAKQKNEQYEHLKKLLFERNSFCQWEIVDKNVNFRIEGWATAGGALIIQIFNDFAGIHVYHEDSPGEWDEFEIWLDKFCVRHKPATEAAEG